jgi:hypothetical protein
MNGHSRGADVQDVPLWPACAGLSDEIALVLRPQPVFTGLQRRLNLEKPANGFPDLGYLSYAEFQRFLVVPEY